jgi:hypothetical protein
MRNIKTQYDTRIERGTKKKRRWVLVFLLLVIGLGIWGVKTIMPENSLTNFKSWLSEGQKHLASDITKVKQLTAENQAPTEIHFEFYSTLPNMQMNVKESAEVAVKKPNIFDAAKLQRSLQEEMNQKTLNDKHLKTKRVK